MTDRNGPTRPSEPTDLADLRARLDRARQQHEPAPSTAKEDGNALGMAWRMSTELVVSVLVGVGLGYAFDRWLGTQPWGLLVGMGFGFAAGIKMVLRSSDQMDALNAGVPLGDDMPEDDDADE